ncbi:MAG: GNAT family N-acetyltransferase [Rudaea sp.]
MVTTFRDAVPADIAAIVALVESAYRGEVSRKGWTTEADLLDGQRVDGAGVADAIGKSGSRVLLAESGRRLLACCHVEKQGDACYFGMFAVAPALQGVGVGKCMMVEAERVAHVELQCREMQMNVISIRDDVIVWYERHGYRRMGVYKPFPYGDERFGIPKRDDLRFEVLAKTL